ncbi:MAG: cytochrome b N-terminal domain-containing protein, partial [Acidimicrobiales bacterium]
VRQKHTQFRGNGRTERNVVGSPMFPQFMAKTTGFLFMITAGLALLGGLAQINPIWQFGPYQASRISYAVQPDWYMGFLDGALRIMPAWQWSGWGHTVPWVVFFPAVLFPGIVFNLCFAWPALERRFTGDGAMHHILDRPRDRPKRTAAGASVFALLFTVFAASSTDVLANYFHVTLNGTLWFFRVAVVVIPIVTYFLTWRVCVEMISGGVRMGKRKRAMVVSRTAQGEYLAVPSDMRPGDEHVELGPARVPVQIDMEPPEPVGAGTTLSGPGVRRVRR